MTSERSSLLGAILVKSVHWVFVGIMDEERRQVVGVGGQNKGWMKRKSKRRKG